jgi:hypothetical protein
MSDIFGAPPEEVIPVSTVIIKQIRPLLAGKKLEVHGFAVCHLVAEFICGFVSANKELRVVLRHTAFEEAVEIIQTLINIHEETEEDADARE